MGLLSESDKAAFNNSYFSFSEDIYSSLAVLLSSGFFLIEYFLLFMLE